MTDKGYDVDAVAAIEDSAACVQRELGAPAGVLVANVKIFLASKAADRNALLNLRVGVVVIAN